MALAAGFFLPDVINRLGNATAAIDLEEFCHLSTQTCTQNSVKMTLEHDTTQPLLPSTLSVEWPNATDESLLLSLQGLEMEMGVVKIQLSKIGNGFYEGSVILPVCTTDDMTWYGTLSRTGSVKNSTPNNSSQPVNIVIRMKR